MANYGQYCPLAKALEIVGDRWTLLVVRELISRGPLRYSEIQDGLPGIATNLLANRLRELETSGVIRKQKSRGDVQHFALTERGEALRPVLAELGRWGIPLMENASPKDEFRIQWMSLGVDTYLRDAQPHGPRAAIQLRVGDQAGVLEIAGGLVRLREGTDAFPDATLEGSPELITSVLFRGMSLTSAIKHGLKFEGNRKVLQRVHENRRGSL